MGDAQLTLQQVNAKKNIERNIETFVQKVKPEDRDEVRKTLNELLNSKDPVRTNAFIQNIQYDIPSGNVDRMTFYKALFYEKDGMTERKSPFYNSRISNQTFLEFLKSNEMLSNNTDAVLFENSIKAANLIAGISIPQKEQQIQPTKEEVPVFLTFNINEIGPDFIGNIDAHIKNITKMHEKIGKSVNSNNIYWVDANNKFEKLKNNKIALVIYVTTGGKDFNELSDHYSSFVKSYYEYMDSLRILQKNSKPNTTMDNLLRIGIISGGGLSIGALANQTAKSKGMIPAAVAGATLTNIIWSGISNVTGQPSGKAKEIDKNAIKEFEVIRENIASLSQKIKKKLDDKDPNKAVLSNKMAQINADLDSSIAHFKKCLESGEKIESKKIQNFWSAVWDATWITPVTALVGFGMGAGLVKLGGEPILNAGKAIGKGAKAVAGIFYKGEVEKMLPTVKNEISLIMKASRPKGAKIEAKEGMNLIIEDLGEMKSKNLGAITDKAIEFSKAIESSAGKDKAYVFLSKILEKYNTVFKDINIKGDRKRIIDAMGEYTTAENAAKEAAKAARAAKSEAAKEIKKEVAKILAKKKTIRK